MTSEPCKSLDSPLEGTASQPIKLQIQGLEHVPSFKNSKMLTRGKLITKPERQKWMKQAIQQLQFQLRSLSATIDTETQMEPYRQFLTALLEHSMGFDDSVQWVKEIRIRVQQCDKGKEGAEIEIYRHR